MDLQERFFRELKNNNEFNVQKLLRVRLMAGTGYIGDEIQNEWDQDVKKYCK